MYDIMCDIKATINATINKLRQFKDNPLCGPNIVQFDCVHQQIDDMLNNFIKNILIVEKQSSQIIIAGIDNTKKANGAKR